MPTKFQALFPFIQFFSHGRFFMGSFVMLLQFSLIFWPLANRFSRQVTEKTGVDKMLAEFSSAHRAHIDPYSGPVKRFRSVQAEVAFK